MSASGTVPLAINPIYTPNTQSLSSSSSSSSKTMNGDNRTHVTSSSMSMSVSSSGENFNFEFIGAGVKLEKSNLHVIHDSGHSCSEPGIIDALVNATDKFKND
jgi:hypothetical protein